MEGFHDPLHPNSRENWPVESKFNNLYQKLNNLKINKKYEINRDQVFLNEAINNIKDDKKKYFLL